MFARILVAIDDFDQSQAVLGLVKEVATGGATEVRALHLRLREVSGYQWYSRETRDQASFVAEAATFELRMAGLAAGGDVRYAAVDRVADAIVAERRHSTPTSSCWAARAAASCSPACSGALPCG